MNTDNRNESTAEYAEENVFLADCYTNDCPEVDGGKLFLRIEPTGELDSRADNVRKTNGRAPFFDDTGYFDDEGWYDYGVFLEKDRLDEMLCQVSEEYEAEEDYAGIVEVEIWSIPLSNSEKKAIFDRIKSLFEPEQWDKLFEEGDR